MHNQYHTKDTVHAVYEVKNGIIHPTTQCFVLSFRFRSTSRALQLQIRTCFAFWRAITTTCFFHKGTKVESSIVGGQVVVEHVSSKDLRLDISSRRLLGRSQSAATCRKSDEASMELHFEKRL